MAGKPVIAILNTWSDANLCHAHFWLRAEDVKRGVWQARGFPMEIPLSTLGQTFMKPTTMLYRNLPAMEAEEAARPGRWRHPLGGCDKTLPRWSWARRARTSVHPRACRADVPRQLAGAALELGTDRKDWAERRAGTIDERTWREMEEGIARSFGARA